MLRILLIDDHEIVRRGLKQLLAEAFPDANFGEAANFAQALALAGKQEWSLVLLDINLPGQSGLDILSELKRMRPKMPILVLSYYTEEEFAIRSLKLGADGYLTKSSVSDEMLVAIRKVLAGGKYVSMSLAEKMAHALGGAIQEKHETLSRRELGVLRMVATGKTIKEIALELLLSEKTIATYRGRISQKLDLSTNVDLARYALKHGLVK